MAHGPAQPMTKNVLQQNTYMTLIAYFRKENWLRPAPHHTSALFTRCVALRHEGCNFYFRRCFIWILRNKTNCRNHDFGRKSVWGCCSYSYDVIATELNWPFKLIPKVVHRMSHKVCKILERAAQFFCVRFRKKAIVGVFGLERYRSSFWMSCHQSQDSGADSVNKPATR